MLSDAFLRVKTEVLSLPRCFEPMMMEGRGEDPFCDMGSKSEKYKLYSIIYVVFCYTIL